MTSVLIIEIESLSSVNIDNQVTCLSYASPKRDNHFDNAQRKREKMEDDNKNWLDSWL